MTLKKRGLGRGLDALLGDVSVDQEKKQRQLPTLPIEVLQRGRFQPRRDFDEVPLRELADSIAAQGVVQPVVVRPAGDEYYELIAGERRWRAAQLAGLPEIPVVVRDVDDRPPMAMGLIENIQRDDLNPLEEAQALHRLLEEFDITHQQIAQAVGKSRTTVTNLMRLLELNPDVKKVQVSGALEMGHARALLALEGDRQVAAAKKIVVSGMTVRAAEKLVKDSQAAKKPGRSNSPDPDTIRLQNELSEKLGAKVTNRPQRAGKGSLIIDYTSLDELEGMMQRIK